MARCSHSTKHDCTCHMTEIFQNPSQRSEITIRQIKIIMYHISLLMECVIFVHVLLQASRLFITCGYLVNLFFCDFSFHATSKKQRSEFQINFKCASVMFGHLEPGRTTSLRVKLQFTMLPAAWTTLLRPRFQRADKPGLDPQ